ncbi:MAG TPA: hypothetical protein VMS17_28720 [Gemmataceae bacterium]|nr:hypothetical protein [Gemmataceae bacterium]
MLELPALLLHPPDARSCQAILDAATGAPAGFSRPRAAGLWDRWLSGATLEVHEHVDESLLCVIRQGRFPRRRLVYDAEGRWVGAVFGRRLEDGCGRVVAVRGPNSGMRGDVFRDPDGRQAAILQPGKHGLALAFTDACAADPFARMLMLAAALHG